MIDPESTSSEDTAGDTAEASAPDEHSLPDPAPALEAELLPATPRHPAGRQFLPALRADLAPLVPPMRRVATVVAVAALADWVVRAGGRRMLGDSLSLLSRAPLPRSVPVRQARSETVIVERIIIHRS
ncbi:MAG: hypothetical protein O7A71_05010 [Chloroflexi bacterium]|nr:hypothetical protein [Chloroflexota bacterium]